MVYVKVLWLNNRNLSLHWTAKKLIECYDYPKEFDGQSIADKIIRFQENPIYFSAPNKQDALVMDIGEKGFTVRDSQGYIIIDASIFTDDARIDIYEPEGSDYVLNQNVGRNPLYLKVK